MAESNGSGLGFTSYSADADKTFRDALQRARDNVADLRGAFSEIARDFYRSEKAIFKLKSRGEYPDLSTKPFFAFWESGALRRRFDGGYKEYKKSKWGLDYPILFRTGKLARAVTEKDAPGNITVIGRQSLQIGVYDGVIPYAKYHQADGPRSRIPLRKFLFVGPETLKYSRDPTIQGRTERWVSILQAWVTKLTAQEIGGVK